MKDEWGNEAPYDFKNIMFKRKLTNGELDEDNGLDTWCYTFSFWKHRESEIVDASVFANRSKPGDFYDECYNNVIKECYDDFEYSRSRVLNDIVLLDDDHWRIHLHSNIIKNNCHFNTFCGWINNCCFESYCSYIILKTSKQGSIQNLNVCSVSGNRNQHYIIDVLDTNATYKINVAKNSQGEVKTYCETDLVG